jgi:ERF superfamily
MATAAAKKTEEASVPDGAVVPMKAVPPEGKAIFWAMPAIMREVGHIEKSRQNPQQGYKFRGIDEVYEAVQLVLAKHGVCVIPFVQHQSREERATKSGGGVLTYTILTVDHTFYAADGSSVVARTVGEAMDSGDKSSNKAMSAAMKYALLESLCIPTREAKDTEEESPEPAPRQAPKSAEQPKPAAQPQPQRQRPWMGKLQGVVGDLKLGEAEAAEKGLKGKPREDFVRDARIAYLRWCVGRAVSSTLDLTDAEADLVIRRAEQGEVPNA